MKKQQYFGNITGAILLAVFLIGVLVFTTKPKEERRVQVLRPATVVQIPVPQIEAPLPSIPVEVPSPIPIVEPPKPKVPTQTPKPPVKITPPKPKTPIVAAKPVVPPPTPKPKIAAETPKPKAPVEIVKPKPPVVIVKPKPPAPTPKPKPVVKTETPKKTGFTFPFFKPKPKPSPSPKPTAPAPVIPVPTPPPIEEKAKIAIVLDDWGYTLANIPLAQSIHYPLTAAVLPNLPYSKEAAKILHSQKKEVILHLPMQPHGNNNLEKNTITDSLDDAAIRKILNRDLDSLVYAKGVNNHMGSLATENERVMGVVFDELKKRKLYFLDSFVTAKSVCLETADKTSIGFAKRDVFLDNEADPEYIRQQIHKLKEMADTHGWAVGIGHDRKNTLKVLSEEMPKLAQEGYRFVTVSELIN